MQEKVAFGRGIRMLRLARGLSQEAFSEVSSLTYVSVLERGIKSTSIEKACELATVLGVHPLALFLAMFIERDGLSVRDLVLKVLHDFDDVARQLPGKVGADPRNRDKSLREVQVWLKGCLNGSASRGEHGVLPSPELDKGLQALEGVFEAAVQRFQVEIEGVVLETVAGFSHPVARRNRVAKTYRNPHTGEVVVAKSRKDGRLKAWNDQYGQGEIDSWIVPDDQRQDK